ncbi:ectonucleotide pyrophosphatase/phosphodiesterase [Sporolactobacillus shoreicorticis]|uniref:Alkaline phosphatase family protein n=1 Tax=Sporolactobacillus shoreicorticis TaxID=1923877 RepID=A0ABW5S514_9BACL|nr:ectonucleotide pyrophosphatase/phosphodiesterase [Sporolactobacillus shoreicorticis]MCO7124469.1 ectonucleotide pyrophosphatase/phosphodiesterase [Sporolactobacillus shoreicorticis]
MVSLDAVSTTDINTLKKLPNFSRLASHGTLVRNVQSVFISNTYPCHSSIITGVHPDRHGLIENTMSQPGNSAPNWRRDAHSVKAPKLYDQAAEIGMDVCSIFYPVTCGAKIKWNFPEVPGKMGILKRAAAILKGGSSWFILSSLWRNRNYLKKIAEPYLDDFTTHIALDALSQKKPDLLLLHLLDADDHKHRFGPDSQEASDALIRLDARLGRLTDAAFQAWGEENTAILVFSDHGCLNVHTSIDPNDWLRADGLICRAKDGSEHYDAFFHNGGGTSFLKILNASAKEAVLQHFSDYLSLPSVKRKLSDEEMNVSGLNQEFLCGIEAADGYSFGEPVKGSHGYSLAHDDYQPFYLAAGPGIGKNEVTEGGCIVDICPLAADLLGIPLWSMDGKNRLSGSDHHGEIH